MTRKPDMQSDLSEINTLLSNAQSAGDNGDFEAALRFAQAALLLAEEARDKRAANCCLDIGFIYCQRAEFEQSLLYFEKAETLFNDDGDERGAISAHDAIGMVFRSMYDYDHALEYHLQALERADSGGFRNSTALTCINIGTVFCILGDFEASREYLHRALSISEEQNDIKRRLHALSTLGNVYERAEDYDGALTYHHQSLAISESLHLTYSEAVTKQNIALLHLLRKEYDQAVHFADDAIRVSEELGVRDALVQQYTILGNIYSSADFAKHDYALAEECLLKSAALSEELNLKYAEVFKAIAALYEQQERWEEAQINYKKYYEYEKEVRSDESRKRIEGMKIRIATKEKEREVQEQRLKIEQLEQELSRQREELSNKALQLVQQTDMLQNFRSNLESIVLQAGTAEKAVVAVKRSLKELPDNLMNWEKFYDDFGKVHPNFERNITSTYPSLSVTEVNVCCLLLIGMSTREISTLLFVSERTVDIHRGHIRKKLSLSRTDDVRTRLEGIGTVT